MDYVRGCEHQVARGRGPIPTGSRGAAAGLVMVSQRRLEEAKSEGLCALGVFERLWATHDMDKTRRLLERIDRDARGNGSPDESDEDGELPEAALLVVSIDSSRSDEITESE